MARLEDRCRQVPGTTCYQDNVLIIVMLQGSAATELSPSDLLIIQAAHECTASGLHIWVYPPYWVDFTILINHAESQELVIYSEVNMSSFNYSFIESLTPTPSSSDKNPCPHGKVQKVSLAYPPGGKRK